MANITRIKAKDSPDNLAKSEPKKIDKKLNKKPVTDSKNEKKGKTKKPFILFRPFVALGTYVAGAWKELRQVRWPNRATTWKMVFAVILYTLIFVVFLLILDLLFQFVFTKILS